MLGKRLVGLLGEPQPGTTHRVGGAEVDGVVVRTLVSLLVGSGHRNTRLMVTQCGPVPATVALPPDQTLNSLQTYC